MKTKVLFRLILGLILLASLSGATKAYSDEVIGQSTKEGVPGVLGESTQFEGVRGIAHNINHGAVVGKHDGGGIAV